MKKHLNIMKTHILYGMEDINARLAFPICLSLNNIINYTPSNNNKNAYEK